MTDVKLEAFIKSKLNKLVKLNEEIVGDEVFLRLEKSVTIENKIAEINLEVKGADMFVKKQSKSFEESLDLIMEALGKQTIRQKEKLRAK